MAWSKAKAKRVKEVLESIPGGRKADSFNSRTFLKGVIENFGGPTRFTKIYAEEYQLAKPGSMARGRILGDIIKVLLSQPQDEADDDAVSDDDLRREMRAYLEKCDNDQPPAGPP